MDVDHSTFEPLCSEVEAVRLKGIYLFVLVLHTSEMKEIGVSEP